MNKKIKNIASVVQTKSAAVLCTLCAVLFLASCAEEEMADGTHSQKQDLRTVSVNFNMPADKPSFGDGTASRAALDAQPAEILLGDSTLAVSRAEGAEGGTESSSPSGSESTTPTWANGDQLLVKIEAGSTQARLTLQYIDPAAIPAPASGEETQTATAGWYLMKDISYVKYTGDDFTAYNAQGVTPMIAGDTSDDDELAIDFTEELTLHLDWTASQPTVSIIYAPDMQWSLAQDNTVSMEQKNSATTATTAPELWTVGTNGWVTNQARLRVNTGTRNAGDVVTLTSSAFDSAWEVEPTVGEGENKKSVFTAVTDDYGDAYFYGATVDAQGNPSALTYGFLVQLTQMRVAVQQPSDSQGGEASPTSEGRSVSLENENTLLITLDTPITLLEASDVVPVTLAAETAYKLMADVKRTASAKTNLSVIDGQCGITEVRDGFYWGTGDQVAAVKKQIETAVAMGVTDFTVVNQLAIYDLNMVNPTCAATVVGEAIRQLVPEAVPSSTEAVDYNGSITLTLADATVVIDAAFYKCTALQSVSAPAATWIGSRAFIQCTGLEEVELDVATQIDPSAFFGCTALQSVLAPAATEIGESVFDGCSSLQSVSLGNVTTISSYAFQNTQVTNLNFDYLTTLGRSALSGLTFSNLEMGKEAAVGATITLMKNAFTGCRLTGSVTFHKVVKESGTNDGLTQKNAFYEVATSELDLFLHAEQPIAQISVSNDGKLMWAGAAWNSITIGDKEYTQETGYVSLTLGTTVYAVIDGSVGGKTEGTPDDVAAVKAQIEAAIARGIYDFTIINQLARDSDTNEAETVVGQAIHDLASDESSPNYGKISITIADATELLSASFYECHALKSVTFNKKVSLQGYGHFDGCTALESVTFMESDNTIGLTAFHRCTNLTGIPWDKVTSIEQKAFQGCTLTGPITINEGVTVHAAAFSGANVSNCDLELAAGQTGVTASGGQLMWAGVAWQSITVGEIEFKAVGDELYMLIADDGYLEYPEAWGEKIKKAIDSYNLTSVYVTGNSLSIYNGNQAYRTVVGEAILSLGESYNGRISLVLAEAAAIPANAFSGCKALQSVVANNATTIGRGAFYECTQITAITFGTVITGVGNDAFGQTIQADAPWTISCALNLAAGQDGSAPQAEYSNPYWAEYEWGTIKVGDVTYYPGGPI